MNNELKAAKASSSKSAPKDESAPLKAEVTTLKKAKDDLTA